MRLVSACAFRLSPRAYGGARCDHDAATQCGLNTVQSPIGRFPKARSTPPGLFFLRRRHVTFEKTRERLNRRTFKPTSQSIAASASRAPSNVEAHSMQARCARAKFKTRAMGEGAQAGYNPTNPKWPNPQTAHDITYER